MPCFREGCFPPFFIDILKVSFSDCKGRCKFNYHTIIASEDPSQNLTEKKHYDDAV
jgi:hypothetical protein